MDIKSNFSISFLLDKYLKRIKGVAESRKKDEYNKQTKKNKVLILL